MKSGITMLIILMVGLGLHAQVSTFPYNESFESGLGAWIQDSGDNFDWTQKSGSTPTSYTGPSAAADGTFYMYTECDGNLPSRTANLVCNFDFTLLADPVISFAYHMYGNEMGTLQLDVFDGSTWNNGVWSVTGQQHNNSTAEWTKPVIDLSAYGGMNNIEIRFRGITGNQTYYDRGDMAIDEISVSSLNTNIISSFPYCESFESGWGDWYNVGADDFDWTRNSGATPTSYTGPTSANNGSYYLFTECDYHLPSKVANFVCHFDFTSIPEPVISFAYHMFGDEMGNLRMDIFDGTTWTNSVWSAVGQQHSSSAAEWTVPVIDLSAYGSMSGIQIRFRGTTGNQNYYDRGDMAIDNICVKEKDETIISSFPYCESFETGWGDWYNEGADDFDWTRNSGSTPTSYTGPNAANDGSYYLFTECDYHLPSKVANFVCNFDFTSIPEPVISFAYHMYGNEMGNLKMDVFDGTTWTNSVWSAVGQQHNSASAEWTIPTIDLSAYGGLSDIKIRFRGTTGNQTYYDRGDMAIDHICIDAKDETTISAFPYCESFETGWGDWYNEGSDDFDWTRNSGSTPTSYTGPSSAGDGTYYLFTECDYHLPSKVANFVCNFDFTSISEPVITFGYHMYGSEMGSLRMDIFDGTTWINSVWSAVGQQHASSGAEWTYPSIDLSAYGGMSDIKVRFRGTTGNQTYYDRGDMAIDHICINQKEEIIINSFPYCESFEDDWGSWINTGSDDFDWTRNSGTTPTSYTGPNSADDGIYYLFTECDYHLPSKTAAFECNFNFTGITDPVISFAYHMYGNEMGSMRMDIFDGTTWTNNVWTVSGQQHSSGSAEWTQPTIDLSAFGNLNYVKVRFTATTGNQTYYDRGDMALDNICVKQMEEAIVGTFPYCESFEDGWGDWFNEGADDFDWTRQTGSTPTNYTGPSAAGEGNYYMFTECDYHLPSKVANMTCNFDFTSIAEPVLYFSYHMYGSETGSMAMDVYDGTTWHNNLWSATGQQHLSSGAEWLRPAIDLTSFGGMSDIRIRFRGTTGNQTYYDRGDMAIDYVCISDKIEHIVNEFPYCESFELDFGNYQNAGGDDFDWTRHSGSTPTNYTGPSSAHDGNYYLYAECDYHLPSKQAILDVTFDFTTLADPNLSFYYHMYGNEMGSLRVTVNGSSVFYVNQQKHTSSGAPWSQVNIDMSAYGGMNEVNIQFEAITGNQTYYDRGDIAIDEICVHSLSDLFISDFPDCVSFEEGFGRWFNIGTDDFDWIINSGSTPTNYTGPNSADDGLYYIYAECDNNLPSKSAIIEGIYDFTSELTPDVTFAYHMYGNEMGTLRFKVNGTTIWSKTGQQQTSSGDPYITQNIDLSTWGGTSPVRLQFEVITGNQSYYDRGDIAVDLISINGPCNYWTGNESNDWNDPDNWGNNVVPNLTRDAIIPDVASGSNNFPEVNSNAQCKDLFIYNGSKLTINPGSAFTVGGTTINLAGIDGIHIESDASGMASYIDGTSNVEATVERYFTGNNPSWHIISSPISNGTANTFMNLYLRSYQETLAQYVEIIDPATPLDIMEGYIVWSNSAGNNRIFEGTLNSGSLTRNVTSTATAPFGWNMIGNPYPSPVDWNLVIPTLSGVNSAIYYLDASSGNWLTWNGIVGSGSQFIPPMQGVFVSASANSSITFENAYRKHSNQNVFYKNELNDQIVLNVTGNGFTDQTFILFDDLSTETFDENADAYKLISDYNDLLPQIYSVSGDTKYSINSLPKTNIVALGFQSKSDGNFVISLDKTIGSGYIGLRDHKTGSITNLAIESYAFEYKSGDDPDRFELILGNESDADQIVAFPNPTSGVVFINNLPEGTYTAEIYSITGTKLLESEMTETNPRVDLSGMNKGVYLLRLQNDQLLREVRIIKK